MADADADAARPARKAERVARRALIEEEQRDWDAAAADLARAAPLSARLPPAIRDALFEHQRVGVDFLGRGLFAGGGSLLADEMGLGKTAQVAAFLGQAARERRVRLAVVVCPPTLVPVWYDALVGQWGAFAPGSVHRILSTAPPKKRKECWARLARPAAPRPTAPATPPPRTPPPCTPPPRTPPQSPPPAAQPLTPPPAVVPGVSTPAGPDASVTLSQSALTLLGDATGARPSKRPRSPDRRSGVRGPRREVPEVTWPAVVVAPYGVAVNDIAELERLPVDVAVLDEAHKMKDPATNVHKAMVRLGAASGYRVAVTGTPVQNDIVEAWALMRFVSPDALGLTRTEAGELAKALARANERSAKHQGLSAAASEQFTRVRRAFQAHTLRREKRELAVVPAGKEDIVVWCTLAEPQRAHYREFLSSEPVQSAVRAIVMGEAGAPRVNHPLVLLTALKKICDHTWLNYPSARFHARFAAPAAAPAAEPAAKPDDQPDDGFGAMTGSCKTAVAAELCRRFTAAGRKTLVFSQSKRLLGILGALLAAAAIPVMTLTGDVPPAERAPLVASFCSAAHGGVCLVTVQVGGVGLTFSACTRVVILDPSWNPATDNQAVDRIHRIGSHENVRVFRLLTCGTVEERIYRNQIAKLTVAAQVTGQVGGQGAHRYFSRAELRDLFTVGDLEAPETVESLQVVNRIGVDVKADPDLRGIDAVAAATLHKVELGAAPPSARPSGTAPPQPGADADADAAVAAASQPLTASPAGCCLSLPVSPRLSADAPASPVWSNGRGSEILPLPPAPRRGPRRTVGFLPTDDGGDAPAGGDATEWRVDMPIFEGFGGGPGVQWGGRHSGRLTVRSARLSVAASVFGGFPGGEAGAESDDDEDDRFIDIGGGVMLPMLNPDVIGRLSLDAPWDPDEADAEVAAFHEEHRHRLSGVLCGPDADGN